MLFRSRARTPTSRDPQRSAITAGGETRGPPRPRAVPQRVGVIRALAHRADRWPRHGARALVRARTVRARARAAHAAPPSPPTSNATAATAPPPPPAPAAPSCAEKVNSPLRWKRAVRKDPGSDLLSHRVAPAVPSALESLTSVFGMGTGVTSPLKPPKLVFGCIEFHTVNVC